jgi:L-glutamine-phosphate cytidylyltransferase
MGGVGAKTLAPIPGHQPLIHYIVEGLKRSGIIDLLVVTGHARRDVEGWVEEHWGAENLTFVFNARYASWGNFHSLRVALDQSPGWDVLAINSDVVVHPDVFRRTATEPGELVLAVETRSRLDGEDMRVELEGSRVRAIGKNISKARSHGEFDGVSLLRPPAAEAYLSLATDVEWTRNTSIYYEDIYQMMMPRTDVRAAFVAPGEYAEVDSPADLAAAVRVIEAHTDAWEQPASEGAPAAGAG